MLSRKCRVSEDGKLSSRDAWELPRAHDDSTRWDMTPKVAVVSVRGIPRFRSITPWTSPACWPLWPHPGVLGVIALVGDEHPQHGDIRVEGLLQRVAASCEARRSWLGVGVAPS